MIFRCIKNDKIEYFCPHHEDIKFIQNKSSIHNDSYVKSCKLCEIGYIGPHSSQVLNYSGYYGNTNIIQFILRNTTYECIKIINKLGRLRCILRCKYHKSEIFSIDINEILRGRVKKCMFCDIGYNGTTRCDANISNKKILFRNTDIINYVFKDRLGDFIVTHIIGFYNNVVNIQIQCKKHKVKYNTTTSILKNSNFVNDCIFCKNNFNGQTKIDWFFKQCPLKPQFFINRDTVMHKVENPNIQFSKFISKDTIELRCNIHNKVFNTHKQCLGRSYLCKQCANSNNIGCINPVTVERSSEKMYKFYILECIDQNNNNIKFLKFGLTNSKRYFPFVTKQLFELHGPLNKLYELEQFVKNNIGEKYIPSEKFSGHTECKKYNLDTINDILQKSKQYS